MTDQPLSSGEAGVLVDMFATARSVVVTLFTDSPGMGPRPQNTTVLP